MYNFVRISNPPRHIGALRRHALLARLFATLPNYAQAETELTAQDCGEAVQTTVDINLSSGVYVYTEKAAVNTPLKIKIPAGMGEALILNVSHAIT